MLSIKKANLHNFIKQSKLYKNSWKKSDDDIIRVGSRFYVPIIDFDNTKTNSNVDDVHTTIKKKTKHLKHILEMMRFWDINEDDKSTMDLHRYCKKLMEELVDHHFYLLKNGKSKFNSQFYSYYNYMNNNSKNIDINLIKSDKKSIDDAKLKFEKDDINFPSHIIIFDEFIDYPPYIKLWEYGHKLFNNKLFGKNI